MEIQVPVETERDLSRQSAIMLTERENEISALIACGLTNPEIATHLGISATTVRTHVDNIFVKLGFHRRVQIAQLYWQTHPTQAYQ